MGSGSGIQMPPAFVALQRKGAEISVDSILDNYDSSSEVEAGDGSEAHQETPETSTHRSESFLRCASNPSLMATPLNQSQVDIYGFKKQTQHISQQQHDEWWARHSQYIEKRRGKWKTLLESNGLSSKDPVRFPPKSAKLKRYIRKGIPPEYRGAAWFWYARGHEKLNAHPDLYQKLCEQSLTMQNTDTEHIERDLFRTFPDNIRFRSDPENGKEADLLQALRRVLVAFSIYQPKIGYCQSLNFVAGMLLLFMPEEHAFWMLVNITQNYVPGLHEVNLEQVNISQGVLMVNIRDRLPKVWQALELEPQYVENFVTNLPPISLCTASWFMSIYVCILPTETMLRVWDCFFFEGGTVLYRIALTIFKLIEPQIADLHDDMEVFQKIQAFPHSLLDPNILMHACFKRVNGFGHLSTAELKGIQKFVADRRKSAKGTQSTDKDEYSKFRPGHRLRSKLRLY